jgi:hypothetical protein
LLGADADLADALARVVVLPMIQGVLASTGAPPAVSSAVPDVTVNEAPDTSRSASTAPGNSRRARWRSRIRIARSSEVLGAPGWPPVAGVAQPAMKAVPRVSGRSKREAMRSIDFPLSRDLA